MNRPASAASRVAVLISLALCGCGGSGPSLIKVSGTVTYNGKPLEGAIVSFLPLPANPECRHAEDQTGPEGNYRAMTDGRTGLVPGKYHVVITKAPTVPAASAASQAFKDDPFMAQMSTTGAGKAAGGSDAIEASFDREIAPDGNVQDFDVKGKSATAR